MEMGFSASVENENSLDADDTLGGSGYRSSNGAFFSKSRKPNWTSHEIRALIEGYDRNRAIMRSRGVYRAMGEHAVNNAKRHKVWESITDAVNRSRPENVNIGSHASMGSHGYNNCVRTVKEVVKKWVNLVNKMKSDIAIKKSNPSYELCTTSQAVHIIVNTNNPLNMGHKVLEGSDETIVKMEPLEDYDDDSVLSSEPYQTDYTQSHYLSGEHVINSSAKFNSARTTWRTSSADSSQDKDSYVPCNLKAAILKRKLQQGGDNAVYVSDNDQSGAKRQATSQENLTAEPEFYDSPRVHSGAFTSGVANSISVEAVDEEGDLKASYRLNKEIMELQRKKLEVEIQKTLVEKEKAEIEKEQCVIEKDMALLRKEKLQLELEQLRKMTTVKNDKIRENGE